jgi:hypothetical protein
MMSEASRAATKQELIDTQCKYCKYYQGATEECGFALEYALHADLSNNLEWYRKNDPDAVALVEECAVFPTSRGVASWNPMYNQQ